ncbi:trypsin-like serine protease [Streptomyces sp. NPDC048304]|uniref:trypsin-like serine protease n=1 Tax=Streptomyces sp. NPDC048304 TaxID=3154820 RepID=UPI003404E804
MPSRLGRGPRRRRQPLPRNPIQGRRLHVIRTLFTPRTTNGTPDAALLVLPVKAGSTPAGLPSHPQHHARPRNRLRLGSRRLRRRAPCRRTSVPIEFVAQQNCTTAQRSLRRLPYPQVQLRAAPAAGAERNTCTRDSGSPVFGTKGTVVALVSWGPSCRIDETGVYVRVASLRRWISRATSHHRPRKRGTK